MRELGPPAIPLRDTEAMEWPRRFAAALVVLGLAACNAPQDGGSGGTEATSTPGMSPTSSAATSELLTPDDSSPPSPTTESPTTSVPTTQAAPDPGEEACEILTEPEVLSIGEDGWIFNDEMTEDWVHLLVEIVLLALESESSEISSSAQDFTDLVESDLDPDWAKLQLHDAARDIAEACKQEDYIDQDWVVVHLPSEDAFVQYILDLDVVATWTLSAHRDEWLPMGADACQRIVDEHNTSGSIPDFSWMSAEFQEIAEDYDLEPADGLIIMTTAVQHICSDYKPIIDDAIEENN